MVYDCAKSTANDEKDMISLKHCKKINELIKFSHVLGF